MGIMRMTVTHSGSGMVLDATTEDGVTTRFDGDGEAAPSPMQHLLAALGACSLIDVDIILRKKRLAFSNLRVECVGARPDEGNVKPFQDVRLVFRVDGEVPQKAFEDAVRLAVERYCSVGETIRTSPPVAYEAIAPQP